MLIGKKQSSKVSASPLKVVFRGDKTAQPDVNPDPGLRSLFSVIGSLNKSLVRFGPEKSIFRQYQPPSHVYCIREGVVRIVHEVAGKEPTTLWLSGPGEIIGLAPVLSNGSHNYSAYAANESELVSLPAAEIRSMITADPLLSFEAAKAFCSEIARLEKSGTSLRRKLFRQNTAALLLRLCAECRQNRLDALRIYSLGEIAAMLDATIEQLYECLSDFLLKRMIVLDEKRIAITDKDQLLLTAISGI